MGFSRKRSDASGKARWTATYRDLRGIIRSAGTWPTKKQADAAWQDAEAGIRRGLTGDPSRGRQTFRKYVEETWFPHHQVEPTTREKYQYCLDRYMLKYFGPMRMAEILPQQVQEWITWMEAEGDTAVMRTPPASGTLSCTTI
ncbi:MAG TPA: N-terminal phage integrase SAM-like domain-containing protein [Streptosporangiaceae bacterium]|nr:N-terminal phage integrase SAM-like domain-containing protein [Streptosporangiaceae bacterium]